MGLLLGSSVIAIFKAELSRAIAPNFACLFSRQHRGSDVLYGTKFCRDRIARTNYFINFIK